MPPRKKKPLKKDDSTLAAPLRPKKVPQRKTISRKNKQKTISLACQDDLALAAPSSPPKKMTQKKTVSRSKQKKLSLACPDDLTVPAPDKISFPSPTNVPQKEIVCPRRNKRNKLSQEANVYDNCSESICDPECNYLSDEQLLEQFSLLQSLQKKEDKLKALVLFEKLRKEEPILTDTVLVLKHIAELEKIKQERTNDFKMKEMMCSKNQLAEILQKITRPCRDKKIDMCQEVYEYTDEERKLILDLILKKKQLNKEISLQQQEILEIEEKCIKLKTSMNMSIMYSPESSKRKSMLDSGSRDELKPLAAENEKINSRIQLLSKIMQFLIQHIESESNLKDDIKVLYLSCAKILNWNYDDLDKMEELCKSVYSTQI